MTQSKSVRWEHSFGNILLPPFYTFLLQLFTLKHSYCMSNTFCWGKEGGREGGKEGGGGEGGEGINASLPTTIRGSHIQT